MTNNNIKNLTTLKNWLNKFNDNPQTYLNHIENEYLSDKKILRSETELFLKTLNYANKYLRKSDNIGIIHVPGRVNLLGMHIDHRMGSVNPISTHNMVMVIQPRTDDRIQIHNCNSYFKTHSFSINESLPNKKIVDWDTWTKKNLEIRILQKKSTDWVNYFQASSLFLQNYIKKASERKFQRLKGFNAFINSNIPYAVGLSSSSSLVVGSALALMAINNIKLSHEELIDFCGTAEWYVGTRGGKGDHAAILIGKKGHISHISFNPFSVTYAPLPKQYIIALCNSMVTALKIAGVRSKFNAGVANYEIGFLLLKIHFPNIAKKIKYLRDVTPNKLSTSESEVYSLLKVLPEKITRKELLSKFPEHTDILGKIFSTHAEPAEGYTVRDACFFGITECIRSEKAIEFLKKEDAVQFGKLMNISHNGDRTTQVLNRKRVPYELHAGDKLLDSLIKKVSSKNNEPYKLYNQSGRYAMSCPETDDLVDIALETDGVAGARLVGAGMGGCVAVLIDKTKLRKFITKVTNRYYKRRNLSAAVEICFPVDGADFINP
ncbi:hypothetical protein KAS50_07345 [bacterium]|nr:hypothetical protein [bacterium]